MGVVKAVSCIALCVCCAPANAIYKCKDADGGTIFSDQPCGASAKQIDVRPARGQPSATPGVVPEPTNAKSNGATERDKLLREADEAGRSRRLREITYEIDASEKRIVEHQETMERKLADLRHSKRYANNNLAGATWESSLSQEMDAITRQYGSLIADEREKIKALRSERESLSRLGKP